MFENKNAKHKILNLFEMGMLYMFDNRQTDKVFLQLLYVSSKHFITYFSSFIRPRIYVFHNTEEVIEKVHLYYLSLYGLQ